jgi:5-methylcytosine-specific restriction endonuclease McrA
MPLPSPQDQVQFLLNIQRLLTEGQFTATYKYALLLALAHLSVEVGNNSGNELPLTTSQLAEKFIETYWRQSVPFPGTSSREILKQNTDRQAAIIRHIAHARKVSGDSLPGLRRKSSEWKRLVASVGSVVRTMPLWKLQIVGRTAFDFLHENRRTGSSITLRPGVAFYLRQFHELITELVRGAWVRYIREQNTLVLGDNTDLGEFLFGSERSDLSAVRPILVDLQSDTCFYCQTPFRGTAHVDHFVPWALYPVDLGHNFVLAHAACNSAKGSRLAARVHLEKWTRRNVDYGTALGVSFDKAGVNHKQIASVEIAAWAYRRSSESKGMAWVRGDELAPAEQSWLELFEAGAPTGSQ